MNENVITIILDKLNRIENKQDGQAVQLTEILSRLAAMEEKQRQQEKINDKVSSLEEVKDKGMGAKSVIAWLIATGISLIALFRQHL